MFVARVGFTIVLRRSSPTIVTFEGTVKGNASSYSPGLTCITTGPCILESTKLNALVNVKNAPFG